MCTLSCHLFHSFSSFIAIFTRTTYMNLDAIFSSKKRVSIIQEKRPILVGIRNLRNPFDDNNIVDTKKSPERFLMKSAGLILALVLLAVAPPILNAEKGDDVPFNWKGTEYINQRAFIESGKRGGTIEPDDIKKAAIDKYVQEYMSQMRTSVSGGNVKVYFHVIRKGTTIAAGNIPNSWITAQINVLNA